MVRSRNNLRQGVSDEVDSIKNDISKLREDLAGLAEALLNAGRDEAGDTKRRVTKEAAKHLNGLRDAVSGMKDTTVNAVESIEEHINDRPITSLLVAFAAGLVFGKIMNRS